MVGQRDDQILCFFYLALIQVVFYDGDRFWTRENRRPTKLKNNCWPKEVLSLKDHAHYFTDLTYLAPWRGAKLGIFIHLTFTNLPWCSQMHTLYKSQLLFISAWSQSWLRFFVLPPLKKIFCITPCLLHTYDTIDHFAVCQRWRYW